MRENSSNEAVDEEGLLSSDRCCLHKGNKETTNDLFIHCRKT